MRKLKLIMAGSAGIWLFTVVILFIFPRRQYPAVSTVFAVLFWLSLIATCFFVYLYISIVGERKKRQQKSKQRLRQTTRKYPNNHKKYVSEKPLKFNPPEVKK